jgi:hypothetical protein
MLWASSAWNSVAVDFTEWPLRLCSPLSVIITSLWLTWMMVLGLSQVASPCAYCDAGKSLTTQCQMSVYSCFHSIPNHCITQHKKQNKTIFTFHGFDLSQKVMFSHINVNLLPLHPICLSLYSCPFSNILGGRRKIIFIEVAVEWSRRTQKVTDRSELWVWTEQV